MSRHYFTVPGWGGSGDDHWQKYFESELENCTRIVQSDYDTPHLADWINGIENVLRNELLENVVLIGHSMGCLAITQWVQQSGKQIAGAFLVAPADIENGPEVIPQEGFLPISTSRLPFPSMLVVSTNDPWLAVDKAEELARDWGSELVWIKNAGHISPVSGYGKWEEGLRLLKEL